ncbi:hypothetical protein BMR86_25925, partial [Stenotrophomonas sp. KAs 5-3]
IWPRWPPAPTRRSVRLAMEELLAHHLQPASASDADLAALAAGTHPAQRTPGDGRTAGPSPPACVGQR